MILKKKEQKKISIQKKIVKQALIQVMSCAVVFVLFTFGVAHHLSNTLLDLNGYKGEQIVNTGTEMVHDQVIDKLERQTKAKAVQANVDFSVLKNEVSLIADSWKCRRIIVITS